MGFFFFIFALLPLVAIIYLIVKHQRTIKQVYDARKAYRQAQERAAEEQERQERVRRRTHPEQSSVDLIQETRQDLDGGEYVEFEEVPEE